MGAGLGPEGTNKITMVLRNPTEQTVSIGLDGVEYSIAPLDMIELPSSLARRWHATHGFLVMEGEEDEVVKEEVVADIVSEDADAVVVDAEDSVVGEEIVNAPETPKEEGFMAKVLKGVKGKKK